LRVRLVNQRTHYFFEMEPTGIIYRIAHKITGKGYIGQTIQSLERRTKKHYSDAIASKTNNSMYEDMRTEGLDAFQVECLESGIPRSQLNAKEIEAIQKYNTLAPTGYNIKRGAGNYVRSEETRKKLSETLKGQPQPTNSGMGGRTHSEATKAKMSASQIGREFSEESRKRMSQSKPKALTPEQVRDILKRHSEGKMQSELADEYNVSKQTINNVVRGLRRYARTD